MQSYVTGRETNCTSFFVDIIPNKCKYKTNTSASLFYTFPRQQILDHLLYAYMEKEDEVYKTSLSRCQGDSM